MIRTLDLLIGLVLVVVSLPLIFVFGLLIIVEDGWPFIFRQERIGKGGKPFTLYKLRSMKNRPVEGSLITVGGKDLRILRVGYFIRKYKLDELLQLFNVLKGDMSLVGPRPEVRRYTDLYNEQQRQVLMVRPGITDYASIEFRNENELLEGKDDPEKFYIEHIMPAKIQINLNYVRKQTLINYLTIIWKTFVVIFWR